MFDSSNALVNGHVPFFANAGVCQGPCGKTRKAQFHALQTVPGTKILNIAVSMKSLLQIESWYARSVRTFRCVKTMSSKRTSDFHNIDELWTALCTEYGKPNFPDLVIMCLHPTRIGDVVKLLNLLASPYTRMGLVVRLFIDEADDGCGNLQPLFDSDHIRPKADRKRVLLSVELMTATWTKRFWETLRRNNIRLSAWGATVPISFRGQTPKEIIDTYYRMPNHHNWLIYNPNMAQRPVEFAKGALLNILKTYGATETLSIFAPAGHNVRKGCDSHLNMMKTFRRVFELFDCSNYAILLINGETKAFHYASGDKTSLTDFQLTHNMKDSELRDVLLQWRKTNPKMHLVITGEQCVARGQTICTAEYINGVREYEFQLTDAIFSDYHFKDEAKGSQRTGRTRGHCKFVDVMRIHATDHLKKVCEMNVDIAKEIADYSYREGLTEAVCNNIRDKVQNKYFPTEPQPEPVVVFFLTNQIDEIEKYSKGQDAINAKGETVTAPVFVKEIPHKFFIKNKKVDGEPLPCKGNAVGGGNRQFTRALGHGNWKNTDDEKGILLEHTALLRLLKNTNKEYSFENGLTSRPKTGGVQKPYTCSLIPTYDVIEGKWLHKGFLVYFRKHVANSRKRKRYPYAMPAATGSSTPIDTSTEAADVYRAQQLTADPLPIGAGEWQGCSGKSSEPNRNM